MPIPRCFCQVENSGVWFLRKSHPQSYLLALVVTPQGLVQKNPSILLREGASTTGGASVDLYAARIAPPFHFMCSVSYCFFLPAGSLGMCSSGLEPQWILMFTLRGKCEALSSKGETRAGAS